MSAKKQAKNSLRKLIDKSKKVKIPKPAKKVIKKALKKSVASAANKIEKVQPKGQTFAKGGVLGDAYHGEFTLRGNGRRKYNIMQSRSAGQLKQAAKKLFPTMTYEEHKEKAKHFSEKYKEAKKKYAEDVDRLFMKEFGRKPEATDYKVSGIYTDDFSAEAKETLRADLKEESEYSAALELHNSMLRKSDKAETYYAGGGSTSTEEESISGDHYAEGGSASDPRVEDMLPHYVGAALWSSVDMDTDGPLDQDHSFADVDEKTLNYFRKIISKFITENAETITASGLSDDQIAHDLWLTQNHHGAGFFDRGLDDDIEKKLIESAHNLGEVDLEVGDDGKIHAMQAYGAGGATPKQGDMFAAGGEADAHVGRTVYDSDSNRFKVTGRTYSGEGEHNGYTLRGEAGEKEIAKSDMQYYTSVPLEKEKAIGYDDPDAVNEIELFAENDAQLYRSSWVPILHNLKKKLDKGTFDIDLAAKLMKYHVERADKEYNKQYGDRHTKGFMLSVKDRKLWSKQLAQWVKDEYDVNKLEGYAEGGYISSSGVYVPSEPETYHRIITLGKIAYSNSGRKTNELEIKIEIKNKAEARDWDTLEELHDVPEVSMSGGVWNSKKTDIILGGQMLAEVVRYVAADKKARYSELVKIWKKYHLNDMNSGTKGQTEALEAAGLHGEDYNYDKAVEHLKLIGLYDDRGYLYGHGWLYKPVPAEVLTRIKELGDSFPEFLRYKEGGQIEKIETLSEAEPSEDYQFKEGGKIANFEANQYSENLLPFQGSHLEGKLLSNGDYLVLSYGHYPIWYYNSAEEKWYRNADRYSNTTARHITQSKPSWDATQLSHKDLTDKIMERHRSFEEGGQTQSTED